MARAFNGSSDFIDIAAARFFGNGTTDWSFGCWTKDGVANTPWGEGNGSNVEFVDVADNGGFVQYVERDGGGVQTNQSGTHVAFDSSWRHFLITHTAAKVMKGYVGGVLDLDFTAGSYGNTLGGDCTIGARFRIDQIYFNGKIAHFAIWNSVLPIDQAVLLAGGLYPNLISPAPAHYWALNGDLSPEPDLGTPGGVSGTVHGTTQVAGPDMHGLVNQRLTIAGPTTLGRR